MSREIQFRIISVLFVGAAVYHAVAFFQPAIGDGGAHWRHAAFCGIDLLCAPLLIRRPKWFVVAFAVLTIQAMASHGAHAWLLWQTQRRLDWLSAAVLIVVPCTLTLLLVDLLNGRSGSRPQSSLEREE